MKKDSGKNKLIMNANLENVPFLFLIEGHDVIGALVLHAP